MNEGDTSKIVPIVVYRDGIREIIGEVTVTLEDGDVSIIKELISGNVNLEQN